MKSEKTINKFIKKHGDRYDYSLVEYIDYKTKVKIICKEHGVFEQTPNGHIQGRGCQICGGSSKRTIEEFIKSSNDVHNNYYDYSLSKYVESDTKLTIICPVHGEFKQTPRNHLKGCGCKKCTYMTYDTKSYIEKASEVHNNEYDYSLVEYVNATTPITIICKKHGQFKQIPSSHLFGNGCNKCRYYKLSDTKESFIVKSTNIHGNIYDYSLVKYVNSYSNVKIICKEHGEFNMRPRNHIHLTQGCPFCSSSKGENEIKTLLEKHKIVYKPQKKFKECKNILLLPFDFYLPKYNTCIEYDGKQHYEPIKWFGGDKTFEYIINNDKIKTEYCKNNNIRLIRIRYDENIEEKIKIELKIK